MTAARTPFTVRPPDRREAGQLVLDGLLVHLLLDVFVAADVVIDRRLREKALAMALPDRLVQARAVVSRVAAAWLWCGGPAPAYLDVVQSPGPGRASGPGVVLHECRIDPSDVVQLTEIAVTGPARTTADLLCTLPPARALEALARLVDATGVSRDDAMSCLRRMRGVRGVAQARDLLTRWPQAVGLPTLNRSASR